MKYITLIIAILTFNQVNAKQQFYKWTDADGNIHYTEDKPKNQKTDEVKIYTSTPTVTEPKEMFVKTNTKKSKQVEQELTQAQKDVNEYNDKVIEQSNNENCEISRKNLAKLQKTSNISAKNETTGKNYKLSDSERIKMIASSKKTIRELCK